MRRVVQAVLYEAIAWMFVTPVVAWVFAHPPMSAFVLSAIMSLVAMVWNYLFNVAFERWEAKQEAQGRSLRRRIFHGAAFEGGLALLLIPIMAVWLKVSFFEAFYADLGIIAFFFIYTITFTWAFDRVFGLPKSATSIKKMLKRSVHVALD
jgi:uncharacterized membrane protein